MESVPPQAIGAIAAAAIAATLAFLGLLVSKEQKTSEFRQAWIDSLRDDLAQLLSSTHVVADAYTAGIVNQDGADWAAMREDMLAANSAEVKIRLRLNPKEKQSQEIIKLMQELHESYVDDHFRPNYDAIRRIENQLIAEAHILLKKEWQRVKRGEPVFYVVKWLSLLLSVAGIAYGVWTFAI